MSEPAFWTFARRPVALALAGVVGLTAFNQLLGSRLEAAAPLSLVSLSGRAVAVDGDTLDLDGRRVRLEGIDAPEMGQTCGRRWIGTWNCGRAAQKALNSLVDGRRIECQSKGQDKYGRELGICFVDGHDINAELVRQGMAWAFVKFSQSYVSQEATARENKTGIWQGTAEAPWTFREQKWQTAETTAPRGCAIKGNITANGKIYHVPWGDWYSKVKVEPGKGERWFCSEAEATEAGWRPAISH
ncbi:MAG: thermonuclease family protein [Hyphomicrobiaceae bacterium]|nr:thermonuclease family protein [Hyphomicrobiaceae bacterium]